MKSIIYPILLVYSITSAQGESDSIGYKSISPLKFIYNGITYVDFVKKEKLWNHLEKQIFEELEKSPTNPYLHRELKLIKIGKDSLSKKRRF